MHGPASGPGSSASTQDERRRRLILEAIEVLADEAFVAPDVARACIDDALQMAGRASVPTIAEGLRAFLIGHVLDAVEAHLGPEAADRFEDSIELVMRAASAAHESAPAPRRGDHGRLVLVASTEPERVSAIARALAKHADVEAVSEPSALPAMLWADMASAVVIDWSRCPLDPGAVDEITASARTGGRLVLWGAPREIEERFLEIGRATWFSCAKTAGPSHVAGIVLALLADDDSR